MNNNGWICLHRQITEHWIWQDPVKLKWWLDLLISANHAPRKVEIGGRVVMCDIGQSVRSLKSWADEWHVSKDTVRRFLNLLQSDGMLRRENVRKTTRITICNYERYQKPSYDDATMMRQSCDDDAPMMHPNNNYNNDNKNINKKDEPEFDDFCRWMQTETPHVARWRQMTVKQYQTLRKNHSQNDIVSVVLLLENNRELWDKYTMVYPTVKEWLKNYKRK